MPCILRPTSSGRTPEVQPTSKYVPSPQPSSETIPIQNLGPQPEGTKGGTSIASPSGQKSPRVESNRGVLYTDTPTDEGGSWRSQISGCQKGILLQVFNKNMYLGRHGYQELADHLGLTCAQIRVCVDFIVRVPTETGKAGNTGK